MLAILERDKALVGSEDHPALAKWALVSLSLIMLLSSVGTSIANVALPTLAQVFSASFQDVQWVVLAYLLAVTTLIVGVGRLGDIIGRRKLLLVGIFGFTIASGLSGIAPTLWLLIAARAIQGLGAAIMLALTMAFVGETVTKKKTGRAMGLLGTMSAIGTALGPSLGGFLIASIGWRAIFLVSVPLGIVSLILAFRYLPADHHKQGRELTRFDYLGTLLLGITIGAYALAMTTGHGHFGTLNIALLAAAVFSAVLFVIAEKRAAQPLIKLATFRNAVLTSSLASNVLVSTVMMATLVVGPYYLSIGLDLNQTLVGIVMALGPIISALSGVAVGRIVDHFGAPFAVICGLVEMLAGSVLLSILPAMLGVGGYVAAIAVLTPGYQLFQAANNTTVMVDIPPDQRGVISGLLNLSRNLGLITGASVMGAVFALATGTSVISTAHREAVNIGFSVTFAVAAFLTLVALAITTIGRPPALPINL